MQFVKQSRRPQELLDVNNDEQIDENDSESDHRFPYVEDTSWIHWFCKLEVIREEPIYLNVYSTPRGEDVECHFYLAVDKGPYQGEIKEEDREICKWFKLDEVEKYLSYENVLDMWNEVKKYIIEEFEK